MVLSMRLNETSLKQISSICKNIETDTEEYFLLTKQEYLKTVENEEITNRLSSFLKEGRL